jgi:TolB-like protein
MSLIAELKRRNVFRVGAAYGFVAWLLIEVAHTAFPTLQLPDWTTTLVTVLLIMGFPIALVIAWAFELTPEGIKRETAVDPAESITQQTGRKLDFIIIGVLAVAVVFFVVDKFALKAGPGPVRGVAEQIPAAERADRGRSIAVLPFVNMSSDPEQEYFSDGLSEEILNLLAKIHDLKVIGRTSSFAFKGKNEDLRSIGQALNVDTVLEGSVRKSGDRVRITAQLIDVLDGAHIWSETYDRTMTDIFAVQDSVASAIIDALQIHVGAAPTRGRPTENAEAYALFLKARAAMNTLDIPETEKLLLETVELDPMFAEAYELLAYCYWWQAGVTVEAVGGQRRVYDAAARAIAIDPSLVFAQAFLEAGNVETYSYLREIEAFERVTREEPSNAGANEALTYDLLEAGYFLEALEVAERFADLDPLSGAAHYRLAEALAAVGRRSEAIQSGELAIELGIEDANFSLGIFSLRDQRYEVGIAQLEIFLKQKGGPGSWVRELVTSARDPKTGQAYLDRRIPQIVASAPEGDAFMTQLVLNTWYLLFGFLDRYYELIFAQELTGSSYTDADVLIFIGTINRESGFTAHPRYLEVVEKTGIVEVWEQRGPPDFCEKVGGQWVCE